MNAQPHDSSEARWVRAVLAVALPLGIAGLIIGAWQIYVSRSNDALVPTPSNVAVGFIRSATTLNVWQKTGDSWVSLAIGYGIAIVIGVTMGLFLGHNRLADRTIGVYVDIALVTPEVVLMPIVLIALGVTRTAVVGVVVLFATPYIIMPIRSGIRAMPRIWFEVAQSLCASRRQVWRFILLPGARAVIATGLRLGLAHALSGLLVVELTLVALGIGQVIIIDKAEFAFGDMFGYIVLVMVQISAVMICISLLERKIKRRSS